MAALVEPGTPVVTITDLYHPPEDPGDNLDLVMPYGLTERGDIRLEAVILDCSTEKRESVSGGVVGYPGPRDPGVIAVTQLNAIFGRQVPYGISPFARMRTPDDPMTDVPAFQQTGPELLIDVLRRAERPVTVMSFGSLRPLAVAYNREPDLLRERVGMVHVSAGSTTLDYLEWNIYLDPLAVRRVIDSDLPVALYPCANATDCFTLDPHTSFWRLDSLAWIESLHPALRRYLLYALDGSPRTDFLRALDDEPDDDAKQRVYPRQHSVWETGLWLTAAGLDLVRRAGAYEIVRAAEVLPDATVIENRQVPCRVRSHDTGLYVTHVADGAPGRPATRFERDDPPAYERAMNEALPAFYASFTPSAWQGSTAGPLIDPQPRAYAGPL